jgi:hypothetical protein
MEEADYMRIHEQISGYKKQMLDRICAIGEIYR